MTSSGAGSTPSTLDIAIVNFNTRSMLRECLRSLADEPRVSRVLVADNGSSDGSLDMLRDEFPDVVAVSLPHNPGFGAAADELVGRSEAEVVLLLNADVRLQPGAIDVLVDHLDAHPDAAIAGPRIAHLDGSLQRSCFDDPSVRELLWQESGLHSIRSAIAPQGLHHFAHDSSREVPWVLGAALAIRRTAFEQVGGFDPGFFLYYEEVDLCVRLRRRGWTTRFVPDAQVTHHGGGSTGGRTTESQLTLYRSLHRFHRIHHTASPLALRAAVVTIMTARIIRCAARSVLHGGADRRRARSELSTWKAVRAEAIGGWKGVDSVPAAVGTGRLDWTVLLPDPLRPVQTVVVLGDVSADEQQAICDHFGVSDVATTLPQERTVDVLVVKATSTVARNAAVAALADDGVAYVEIERRVHRSPLATPGRAERSLCAGRSSIVGSHWMLPGAAEVRRFIPLDDVAALRWYLENLLVPVGLAQRIARAITLKRPSLVRWIAHSYAIVLTSGPCRPPSLLQAPEVLGAGVADGDRLVVLSSGLDTGSRSIVLPFPPGSDRPRCVIKVSGRSTMNEATAREHRTLCEVGRTLPADLVATVPRALALFEWKGRAVSVESHFSGRTLEVSLRRADSLESRVQILHEVTNWIIRLHEGTAEPRQWTADDSGFWFGDTFDRYCHEFNPSSTVRLAFTRALDRSLDAQGLTVPIVQRHFDLAPWNIICVDDGIGVIDWETPVNRSNDNRGLPLCDLAYFAKFWLHIVATVQGAQDEVDILSSPASASDFAARYIISARKELHRYCEELGVPGALIPALMLYNWAEHSLSTLHRDRTLGSHRTEPPPTVVFVESLAQHAEHLFVDAIWGPMPGVSSWARHR
jgi:GT2 family glycosyltransferase